MQNEVHVGDIGTIFEIEVKDGSGVVDISSATTKEIIFRKPDGTIVTQAASFVTSGTDGKIDYTTMADDIDAAGNWRIQGKVVITAGTFYTDISEFKVYVNL